MARLSFFIGKGGVGKTTVSAAYACWRSAQNKRARQLLLSTDPAHSLGDVLQRRLGDEPKRITAGLYARELDATAELRRFLQNNRGPLLKILDRGSLFSAEDLAPLLDATLPGMAELAGLLAIDEALESGEWDEIIVDTAPMGHTLRMFEMPQHFLRVLKFLRVAGDRDRLLARRFAGRELPPDPFLEEWTNMVERLRDALAGEESHIVLVSSAESFAVEESLRAKEWLASIDRAVHVNAVVINRAVRREPSCQRCRRRAKATAQACTRLADAFSPAPVHVGVDPGAPLLGPEQLRKFGAHIFEDKPLRTRVCVPSTKMEREFSAQTWPSADRPLSLTVGKGGVGKTTISAALAVRTREEEKAPVLVCSVDPAPSLDDVFAAEVGDEPRAIAGDTGLWAVEIDSVGEYRRWAERIRDRIDTGLSTESGGIHVDLSYDRELLDALLDVVPPGVDELLAVLRIQELVDPKKRVIVDMAPTGHALELLRTPDRMLSWTRMLLKTLAANRTLPLAQDAAVEVATVQQQVRSLAALLRGKESSGVWAVMLAEPLPDRETRRLLRSLAELDVRLRGVFVNRVRLGDDDGCRRCSRARRWQFATLERIGEYAPEFMVVPEVAGGVAGLPALRKLTRSIWRLA